MARGGSGVDRDAASDRPPVGRGHYGARTVRRSSSPVPSRPRPIATHAHTFIPVNGSVLGWELVEEPVPLESDGLELVLVGDCVVCVSGALLVGDDELLELEGLGELDELLGCDVVVVVVPVRGSVYC